MSLARIMFLVFLTFCFTGTVFGEARVPRKAPEVDPLAIVPLRAALQDLMTAFGPRYPRGREFLSRLDQIAQKAQAANDANLSRLIVDFRALRREALLANPLLTGQPIVFVTRSQYAPDHHNTETLFLTGELNTRSYRGGGALKVLDPGQNWTVRTVVDAGTTGLVRDPDVHFEGTRILFSMRRDINDDYHIYEVSANGSGLKQLTRLAHAADIDPIYLPDDHIVFSSTRDPKYCGCNRHIMANLYRMAGDGANIHRIGGSNLFEGHNRLMPDGRVLYYRWEYIDRNFGDAQGLWTVRPDGTGHALYWGNNKSSPGAVVDPRPIPGTDLLVCTFTSCHDRPWGALAIIDRRRGLDVQAKDTDAVLLTWPRQALSLVGHGGFDTFTSVRPRYEDPYPLSDKYFLCARELGKEDWQQAGRQPDMGIYLVDTFGNEVLVHAEGPGCFNPVPLAPRVRPPVLPTQRTYDDSPATVYIQDVYQGTHMQGVKRGEVKSLRVIASLDKRHWTRGAWNGQGQQAPALNWHNFENKSILGTVPVEEDGSAYLEVPPDTYVFCQLLDRDGAMIQSMRSGVVFQPGEKATCVGCHENRLAAPPTPNMNSLALRRSPRKLQGWHGSPRPYSYLAEMQPVWDRHCVSCHDFGKPAGQKLLLAGDRDLFFNASYEALHQNWNRPNGWIQTVGAGPAAIQPANSWGARVSRLVDYLRKGHEKVNLSAEDWDRILTWIDLNAPYYPSSATAYPDNLVGRCPLDNKEIDQLKKLTGINFASFASWSSNRGALVSLDRPELSPCLVKLGGPGTEKYDQALAILRLGQERLKLQPRGDLPDFEPCATDRKRDELCRQRQQLEKRNRAALQSGNRIFDPE